ncbi:MAG TPA: SWIM zinc finger family protein, partial [Acidobacteriota bacterium]|nr:SWIM zinc finger family protein [Acidobacteriota bacterium]
SAVVLGTKPYRVSVEARRYGLATCECYLGQKNILCKHMTAVAIYAVMGGKKLSKDDKEFVIEPKCSNRKGELSKEELDETKKAITSAMRYIKPYRGPSRIWFTYQNSLNEGCARLSNLVSKLPVSTQTAELLVNLLLRLDKKLRTGVDDSDGTVGGFIRGVVEMLQEYVKREHQCIDAFEKLCGRETCFEWEEPLVRIFDERE